MKCYPKSVKVLVVYDSNFGNTKVVAETISDVLGKGSKTLAVSEFKSKDMEGVELLVAGSPINGWRPTERMMQFLENLGQDSLKGIKASSFDTRINIFFHGDAAEKIAKGLLAAGAEIISQPQAFFVSGKEGPLKDGEKEKAKEWAKRLKKRIGA